MRPIKALRALVLALACAATALLLLSGLTEGLAERRLMRTLQALPDHDFVPDILTLKQAGRITEALDWARYVTNNPALPNQAAASNLVVELEKDQQSVWLQADRAAKGFLTGSGASVEEMGGAVISDMVVYGDCRDLVLQGYYRATGREADSLVAALAGVGLLTELVDAVDWAPAVLKAFRKANALSNRFADWLLAACRHSTQARKLDPALAQLFKDLRRLHGDLGLAKSATVFKQVGSAEDVALLAKHAKTHPGEVYRLMATTADDGLPLLRRYAGRPRGFDQLALATRKGLPGLNALRKGGELRSVTLYVRYGERVLRTVRLERPQKLLGALAMRSPSARNAMWAGVVLLSAAAVWLALTAVRREKLPRHHP